MSCISIILTWQASTTYFKYFIWLLWILEYHNMTWNILEYHHPCNAHPTKDSPYSWCIIPLLKTFYAFWKKLALKFKQELDSNTGKTVIAWCHILPLNQPHYSSFNFQTQLITPYQQALFNIGALALGKLRNKTTLWQPKKTR